MPVHPDSLKVQMDKNRMTITSFAAKARISAKQISRLLKSETPSHSNAATIDKLCKALGTDPATLAAPPSEVARKEGEEALRKAGHRRLAHMVPGRTILNYDLARARYGVPGHALIEAAPLLFTLVVEMHLKHRARALEAWSATCDAAQKLAPTHLSLAFNAVDHADAYRAEADAIARHDLSGRTIEGEHWHGENRDLFVDWLRDLVRGNEIDVIQDLDGSSEALRCQLLEDDLWAITGGDFWARFALERVHVRLGDIPSELRGDDRQQERARWLADRVPADARAEHEAWLASMPDIDLSVAKAAPPPSSVKGA